VKAFIVDAQLPPALAAALREAGYDARAVRELGLREAADADIWEYAITHECAVVTKDQDFSERLISTSPAPVVVWLRIGNSSNRALLAWLLPLWPDIVFRIASGDHLVEVRERVARNPPDDRP
jgi:predicted nuclease of predicted toxin-antitoxin system